MTETKKEPQILELRGHGEMQLSECLAILMLKVKQRSCNTLKTILHGKVISTRNSCLDSQIEIPAFFFFGFQLCFFISLIMHQYIPVSSLIIFRAESWPFLRSAIPWVGR